MFDFSFLCYIFSQAKIDNFQKANKNMRWEWLGCGQNGVAWWVMVKPQYCVKVFSGNFPFNFRVPTKKPVICHPGCQKTNSCDFIKNVKTPERVVSYLKYRWWLIPFCRDEFSICPTRTDFMLRLIWQNQFSFRQSGTDFNI